MAERIPLPAEPPARGVPRLVAIVDVPTCRARGVDPLAAAGIAADAGAPAVLLRGKELSVEELTALADSVVRFCRHSGALAFVAAAADVAAAVGADGVHLPSARIGDAPAARAAGLLTTVSVHDHGQLLDALAAGADALVAAPVFDPSSKPAAGPALGLDGLASLCRSAGSTPVLALGGITPDRVAEVRGAGAFGVAALGPFSAPGGGSAVRAYLRSLRAAF